MNNTIPATRMRKAAVHPIQSADTHPRKKINVLDLEMSYVDVGQGDPIVFLHGNPTSSYLWRNIIPYVSNHNRCFAPDLVGMGQSDKAPRLDYKFFDHSRYLDAWFDAMNFQTKVTLVLHDWGSALGFYWAWRNPSRIKAIAYMESIVQPRRWEDFTHGRDTMFRALRSDAGENMVIEGNFFIETVLPKSIIRQLNPDEMEAYRAPFRQPQSRRPTLVFPRELPIDNEPADVTNVVEGYGNWLSKSTFPKLLITAEPGALLVGRALSFCRQWPNQREVTVKGIHYIQEDSPTEIGLALQEFISALD